MDDLTKEEKTKRRAKYLREFSREVPDESDGVAGADFTRGQSLCCHRFGTTRATPCRNLEHCPLRPRENDHSAGRGGRERTRGYES